MIPDDELRHIQQGARAGEQPHGVGLLSVLARCPGNAAAVADRVREVMTTVVSQPADRWPAEQEWLALLPEWFVKASPPAQSEEEAQAWLRWWRALPANEQAAAAAQRGWAVADWVYWFTPGERQWFWWDMTVQDPNTLRVRVDVVGQPVPLGSLQWLLSVAGAEHVSEPEED